MIGNPGQQWVGSANTRTLSGSEAKLSGVNCRYFSPLLFGSLQAQVCEVRLWAVCTYSVLVVVAADGDVARTVPDGYARVVGVPGTYVRVGACVVRIMICVFVHMVCVRGWCMDVYCVCACARVRACAHTYV